MRYVHHILAYAALLLFIGCSNESDDKVAKDPPPAEVDTAKLELENSLDEHLQPLLQNLRDSGCHERPGITTLSCKQYAGVNAVLAEKRWYKTTNIVDLDNLRTWAEPENSLGYVAYTRQTFRSEEIADEALARAADVDFNDVKWTAEVRIKYRYEAGTWTCVETQYKAIFPGLGGQPDQVKDVTRPGVDFLERELQQAQQAPANIRRI